MQRQDKPAVRKRGWFYAAAFLSAAISLSCSLVTRTLSQPLQVLNTGAPLGRIAYSGVDGNIYTVDREGKQQAAITRDAIPRGANASPGSGGTVRVYQYPTWAPDGRSLAFAGFAGASQTDSQATVYTASSDGKKIAEVFKSQTDFPIYLFWSPNSKFVSFISNEVTQNRLTLRLAAVEGDNKQAVGTGQPFFWDWSPDNRTILAHTGGAAADNPNARVALYAMDGSEPKKELNLKPAIFQAPAWSPDGEELVLAAENDAGEGELVLAGRDGTLKRTLVTVNGPVAFAWSPDGARLAYAAAPDGQAGDLYNRLALLDPAQPDDSVDVSNEVVVGFFWSPDSKKIVYFVPSLEEPGGSSSQVSQSSSKLYLRIQVFDLVSGDSRQAAIIEPTDAFLQILPFFDQYQRSGTIWSPDSSSLVLPVIDKSGNSRIVVIGADGGSYNPIADGDLAFWSWK